VKVERAHAYPLAVGTPIQFQGRVKECANLIEPGHRLLDIGCSSGWLAQYVADKGFKTYIGIDRVIVGAEPGNPGSKFLEGSVFNLPFRDEAFDAATLFDVVEHLPKNSEGRALREVHRILRKGGKLYFSTPHASPLHSPLDPVWLLGHRHYRRRTIRRMLESTGFAVERMFVAGGAVEGLDHIRLLVYKHVFHRPLPSYQIVSRLIERAHGRDRRLGMTVFAVAARQAS
jgi:SAM-dependent methyltransferase